VVATTDPEDLPDKATRYLVTNLSHPECSERAKEESKLEAANLAEIVRLYGLRMWIEQSYKQVKHVPGWSEYQVRSDLAIGRHWELVCCAFSFCWWAYSRAYQPKSWLRRRTILPPPNQREGEKETRGILATDFEDGKGVVGALRDAPSILEGVLREAPTVEAKGAASEGVFGQRTLSLCTLTTNY
jgi:hypothetical protein